MSEDTYQIETRRRSRSKTPFLRSSCDHENCEHAGEEGHVHHKKKKSSLAPNVHTIIEEHVVESSSSAKKTARGKAFAHLTSDYSSDDMTPEAKRKQTATTTTSVTTSFFSKRMGGATTSTPRNKSQLESSQNSLNSAQEHLSKSKRSNGNLSAGDISDHLAYIEYRDAGEYWNKTPKTDYTYSELSPHRRHLAPGIVAMPNMSRRSLENHDERVNYMVQQNPSQEDFIRRRYQSQHYAQNLNYDSSDELDATRFGQQQKQGWSFLRLLQVVVTTVTTVWSRITSISETETNAYHNYYAKQQREKRGLLGNVAHAIGGGFSSLLRYVYVFIASVLSLDTWLLRSSNGENKSKKRFLLFLLILLPLLLLTGLFYYLHPNETFPPKSFTEYTKTITLPEFELPKINVSEYLNREQFESVRTQAVEQAVRVRDWADDYLIYLKTIGHNVVDRGRQLFQANEEVYYERI